MAGPIVASNQLNNLANSRAEIGRMLDAERNLLGYLQQANLPGGLIATLTAAITAQPDPSTPLPLFPDNPADPLTAQGFLAALGVVSAINTTIVDTMKAELEAARAV